MLIIIDFSVEREKKKKGRSRLFSHLFQQNREASTWFVSNGSFKWKVMSALACLSYPGSVRLHTANEFLPALVVNKNLSRVTPQKYRPGSGGWRGLRNRCICSCIFTAPTCGVWGYHTFRRLGFWKFEKFIVMWYFISFCKEKNNIFFFCVHELSHPQFFVLQELCTDIIIIFIITGHLLGTTWRLQICMRPYYCSSLTPCEYTGFFMHCCSMCLSMDHLSISLVVPQTTSPFYLGIHEDKIELH